MHFPMLNCCALASRISHIDLKMSVHLKGACYATSNFFFDMVFASQVLGIGKQRKEKYRK